MISLSNHISSVTRKKLPLTCSVPSSASFGSFVASFLQSALFNKSFALRGKKCISFNTYFAKPQDQLHHLCKLKCKVFSAEVAGNVTQRQLNTGLAADASEAGPHTWKASPASQSNTAWKIALLFLGFLSPHAAKKINSEMHQSFHSKQNKTKSQPNNNKTLPKNKKTKPPK